MAGVFLSYDRDDAKTARPIALALEKAGHSVWWDLHVRGGAQFAKVIEEALKAADAVVVLWSANSVESAWVRDEAAAGRDSGRLVPVTIDGTEAPLGFRQYQTIDLSQWKGRASTPQLRTLVQAVGEVAGAPAAATRPDPPPVVTRTESAKQRRTAYVAAAALALLALAVGIYLVLAARNPGPPRVAVTAGDGSPNAAAMARDLLVSLGRLQASNPESLELVGNEADKADLVLQVTGSSPGKPLGANLALADGGKGAILWSRDFDQPNGRAADLREQLAYSAAQVLGCASEAVGAKLGAEPRKLYLNGCAEFAQSSTEDVGAMVSMFEAVTRAAPTFRDGWAKLLLAESALVEDSDSEQSGRYASALRQHVAEARSRLPDLPEIRLAEISLLPTNVYAQRLRLADAARALGADDPYVYFYRSRELGLVGRMSESVRDAEAANRLDPLSPKFRNGFIAALAYSGMTPRAQEVLKDTERLWPRAWTTLEAKFRLNLRYGDPAVALQILRENGTSKMHEAFLEARIDPTPEKIEHVLDMARAKFAETGEISDFSQLLAEFGREDEVYAALASHKGRLDFKGPEVFFRPNMKRFRQDPRFIRVAALSGLVDYWRTSGIWADFCSEPDLPYDCKAEAAKPAGARA
jgi:hypothetical protein